MVMNAQKIKSLFIIGTIFLFSVLCGTSASANASIVTDEVQIRLISGVTATGGLDKIPLGLDVRLQPGWKIYWRSPGEAGLPPTLRLPQNTPHRLEMDFPVPTRFSLFGLDSYGYAAHVIFPLTLSAQPRSTNFGTAPLNLEADLDALVCADICIPVGGVLTLFLPSGTAQASAHAQEIARFASNIPKRDLDMPLDVTFDAKQNHLLIDLPETDPLGDPLGNPLIDIFIETDIKGINFSPPIALNNGLYQIDVRGIDVGASAPANLAHKSATLTIHSASMAFETQIVIGASVGQQARAPQTLLWILLAALLGGLILNIMPCVLPILSIKLAHIISMGEQIHVQAHRGVRIRLLAGAAGILSFFALLALSFAALKQAGLQLGWGVQFQSPIFLSVMIMLMGLFTLMLLGRVTIAVPLPRAARGSPMMSAFMGDFMSGFMAAILATPCSAPLVGTAISFAFTAPPLVLMLILLVMGLGLALPWLGLAACPSALRFLPRSGRWLAYINPLLALGMGGTMFWLFWLFWLSAGTLATAILATGLIAGGIILWSQKKYSRMFALPLLIFSFGLSQIFITEPARLFVQEGEQDREGNWQSWSQPALALARQSGKPVFVDVTAAWCVTCQVNKRLVLDRAVITKLFADKQVITLRADWTQPNQAIADYLLSFHRFGIPFNALYLPGQEMPIIFSELLSAQKIISALEKDR